MADESAGLFGIPSGVWAGGGAALGGAADVYAFVQQERQRQQLNKIYDILSNPAKLSDYVNRFYQPMSGAAIAATNRDLGANWATMTGGAPGGAMNQFTADAFAKIETQRQQTATDAALRALTNAGGNAPAGMPMGNLQNILRSLSILRQLRGRDGTDQNGAVRDDLGISLSDRLRDSGQGVYPMPETVGAGAG